ncbi:hypothetical protein NQ314_012291 [Rhamnusium bicolor]|uniref:Uncharacterized protein n=1 Tax=Rhamnusium bicolor TaxID=1586634 RepID=A0AAV8XCN6_9CUCU|nr:hypothetical protein NQ314_012291 [Rhamnusium bicolor]
MSRGKLGKWLHDNMVLLIGIPLIVGVHYGWWKLQQIPALVDQSQNKEIPIIGAIKALKNKTLEKYNSIRASSNVVEPQEK